MPSVAGWVLFYPVLHTPGLEETYELNGEVWVDATSSFSLDQVVLRWSLPSSAYVTDALGSGITWALHPSFCARMLPHFPEEDSSFRLFLTCDALRATIASAFDTWAANHPRLNFKDVTMRASTRATHAPPPRCT